MQNTYIITKRIKKLYLTSLLFVTLFIASYTDTLWAHHAFIPPTSPKERLHRKLLCLKDMINKQMATPTWLVTIQRVWWWQGLSPHSLFIVHIIIWWTLSISCHQGNLNPPFCPFFFLFSPPEVNPPLPPPLSSLISPTFQCHIQTKSFGCCMFVPWT